MDNYSDTGRDGYDLEAATRKLKIVSDYARKHKKLAAFTETGLESFPNEKWWKETKLSNGTGLTKRKISFYKIQNALQIMVQKRLRN
ncbi:hypothetical protein [Algoriphagus antarcticus]|nr:hypothetical protein [Algoriphagus antarcticus]